MLTLTKQQVTTLLTIAIVVLWVLTAVVRIWLPFPAAYVLDAAMPLVIGFYFVSKNGKDGDGAAPAP